MAGSSTLGSARRYRLRCLRPVILRLDTVGEVPVLRLAEEGAGGPPAAAAAALASGDPKVRQHALLTLLVGELVLGTKEMNTKTRTAAYQLLVELAHELEDSRPLSVKGRIRGEGVGSGSEDDMIDSDEEYGAAAAAEGGKGVEVSGGLMDFVHVVMGGLVGSTPHMQSASVMALARLTYEFVGQLEGLVPQLLPAILMLLRSNSREVVKSVLGYLKVRLGGKGAERRRGWWGRGQG